MSAKTSEIGIKLTLDGAQQAEAGLRRVSGGLDSVSDSSVSAKAALAGLAGAFAGAVSMQQFVQAADAVTTLNNQLRLATGSTQAAGVAYNELYEIAQRSRVSFTELGSTFASISRAGQSLGKSQGQLLTVTEAIGNAMAISGGSAQGMEAALTQLAQGLASGTLRGEELNSVMDQTPRLAKAIADGLGVSTGKLREMGAAGQLTAEQVIEALTRQAEVLKKEVEGSATTVAQAMVKLGNATTVAAGEFAKASGISTTLASAIGGVTTAVDAMGKAFAGSEVPIKTTMGVMAGAGVAAGVAALASNIGKVTAAVRVLGAVLTTNPYVLALMGISMAVGGFISYNYAQSKTLEGMKATLKELEDLNKRGRTGMYGNQVSDEVWNKRQAEISRLRQEIALLDAQSLDTRAEDARLAATKASTDGTQEARQALAALTGQHKEYLPTLEKYQGWLKSSQVTQEQYVALVTDLAKKNYKLDESHKQLKEGYVAGRDAAELYGKAVLSAGHMLAQAEGKVLDLDKAQTALAELQKDPLWAQMPQTWRDIIEAQYGAASAAIRQKEANEGVAKAYAESFEASTRETQSLEDQIKAREAEVAAIGQSHQATAELAAGKLELAAAEKEAYAAALEGASAYAGEFKDLYLREAEAARDQAGKLRRLAGLEREKGIREAAEDASKEWAKAAEKIENTLTDALMRGFESGKGFAEVLRDTVVNMFKTMVLRPVVSAIVNPVAGALLGSVGMSTAAQAGSSGAGSMVGSMGQAAMGSMFTGWGTAFGQAAMQSLSGAGFSAAVAEGTIQGLAAGAGSTGASIMANTGAAAPYLAAAAAVAAVVAKGLSREKISEGVQGHWSGAATGFTGAEWEFHKGGWARSDKTVNRAVSAGTQTALDSAFDSVSAGVLAFNKALGGSADTLADWSHFMQQNLMGLSPEKVQEVLTGEIGKMTESMAREVLFDLGKGALGGDVLGGIDAKQARIAELETAMMDRGARKKTWLGWQAERDALQSEVDALYNTVIGPFQKAGETAQQTLARLGGSLGTINAAFDTLGLTLLQGVAGAQQASSVLDAFGGADAFNQLAGSYYQAFYSEAEKTANVTKYITETLASVGLAMPTTREAFRDLTNEYLAMGIYGAETAAVLLAVSGAFASVTQAAEQAAQAERERASTLRGSFGALAQSLADMRGGVADADARVAASRMAIWQGYADAQQKVIDLEMQAADATRSFAQSLRSFIGDMATGPQSSMGLESRYRTLQQQLQQTAAQAGAGDQGARDRLTGVASSYLDAARARSSTSVDYARDAARVRVMLGNVASTAEADPLVQKYDAESLTIQQQIADAQIDVVKYLALMEATGTSTDLGIQSVDKTLSEMRDEYIAAEQAQAAANLKLDVALAALDALGLTESLVNAIAANQTSSLSGALNISDEALSSITGALGLTPENVAELGQQFAVEVALLVGQAATDLAATLQSALAFDPTAFDALRTVVGYDTTSPDFAALQTILGFDLESDKFRALGTILGMAPGASAQVDALLGGIGFTGDAAAQAAALTAGLAFADAAREQIALIAAGVSLTDAAGAQADGLNAGVGWAGAVGAQVDGLNAGIALTGTASDQVNALLSGLTLSGPASEQVDGLLDGLKLAAADRVTIERMLGGIGLGMDAAQAFEAGIGVRPGLLDALSVALGLSPESLDALGVLSTMGTLDKTVRDAYALIGRTGVGTGVNQIDADGLEYWKSLLATGAVSTDAFLPTFFSAAADDARADPEGEYADYISPYLKKLRIPGFAVGTNYVPYDMIAQIHEGEAIVPKAYNPAAGGGGNNNAEMVAELRAMRAELAELRAIKSELAAINRSSSTTATGMTGIVNKQVSIVTEAA